MWAGVRWVVKVRAGIRWAGVKWALIVWAGIRLAGSGWAGGKWPVGQERNRAIMC